MALLKRSGGFWVLILLLAAGFFLLREKRSEAVPGTFVINNLRTFASLDNSADDCDATVGVFHPCLDNLEIDGPNGVIRCNDGDPGSVGGNACNITIVVNANMDMLAGSKITADNTAAGGSGGDIDITVGGNLTLQGTTGGTVGALISARKLAGAGDTGTGGDITIKVGGVTVTGDVVTCVTPVGDINVGKGAQITSGTFANPASFGPAGVIKIYAGHNIAIDGSVTAEGTSGAGHGGPITIKACCDLLIDDDGFVSSRGADPGADLVHLEACTVEILGLVQSTGPGHFTPNVNLCNVNRPGKPPNSSGCVEIWSGTTILIDNTGTNNGVVNADVGQSGGTQGSGWIDVLANLDITIHGDPTTPYNAGGDINNNALVSPPWSVHANMNLQNGHGGDIAVQSKLGNVTTSGRAIQANSSIASNGGKGGHVKVEGAGNVAFGNASIQAMGDLTGGAPAGGTIVGHAFNLGSTLTGAAPGQLDAAGPGGNIKLFGCAGVVYTGVSNPAFVIDPVPACGDPVVLPSPADTNIPSSNCQASCVTPTPTPTPTNTTTAPLITNTPTPTPTAGCNKSEVIGALAGHVPDKVVRLDLNNETIQHAVDTAADDNHDGFVIVLVVKDGTGQLGGHTNQRVTINRNDYGHPFQLFGCSVTMHDPDIHDGLPTGWITAGAGGANTIFAMDLHGADSDVAGWKVEGNGRTLRNVEGDTSGVGVWFVGNNNTMHNGKALHNTGVGVLVSGDSNVVTDTLVEYNTGNGIEVHGNNNQILKTQLGDIGKGNTGDGLNVASGTGNLLSENTSRANSLDGFHVLTGGNTLTKNISGGTATQNNGPCEYDVAAGNTNGGGNKAHGVLVTGSPFPAGCIP